MFRPTLFAAGLLIWTAPRLAPARPIKSVEFPPALKVSFTTAYDDNILRYSALDLHRFDTNTEPIPSEITTTDDWINSFGVWVYTDFRLNRSFRFRPSYSGKLFLHAVNPIKNYQYHSFQARLAYRGQAYLSLKYFYLPGFYLQSLQG